MDLTNSEIVQYLANGYTVIEIEAQTGVKRKTIEKRLYILKKFTSCKTYGHLIANFLRKKIIE